MPRTDGYITLDEAVKRYGHTRAWWYKQFSDGLLTPYDIAGERNTFLREADVEAFFQPKPRTSANKDAQVG